MKTFLAIYMGSDEAMAKSGWMTLSDAERMDRQQRGISAWHQWAEEHHSVIIEMGGPLGKTKAVSSEGINDIKNNLTGYTIVRAESHDDAAKLFLNHPHFTIFPGDSVEIMEILPVPEVL